MIKNEFENAPKSYIDSKSHSLEKLTPSISKPLTKMVTPIRISQKLDLDRIREFEDS